MNGQRGADKDFSKVELGEYPKDKGNLYSQGYEKSRVMLFKPNTGVANDAEG